jgi:hypothetical protein
MSPAIELPCRGAIGGWLAACLVALLPAAAGAADCSALATGIDRGQLVYYVEDGAKADALGVEWTELGTRLTRAEEWLTTSSYFKTDAGEAIVNARRTVELVRAEVPKLRAQVAAMPEDGPSFPPIFYWPEGWPLLGTAVLDSLLLRADYLERETDALARGDWDEANRINNQRNQDLAGFEGYFAAFDGKVLELLPEDHPERVLIELRIVWYGITELYAERDRITEEEHRRASTVAIAEKLRAMAKAIDDAMMTYDIALNWYEPKLLPFFETLTCDRASAEAIHAEYMKTYREFPDLAVKVADLLRENARLEMEFWSTGATEELYDRFNRVAYEYDAVYDRIMDGWSSRARLMVDAIAD